MEIVNIAREGLVLVQIREDYGEKIILKEGVQQDFGYPYLVQNKDGDIVIIYLLGRIIKF